MGADAQMFLLFQNKFVGAVQFRPVRFNPCVQYSGCMQKNGKSAEFSLAENRVFGEWSCQVSNVLDSERKITLLAKKWSLCRKDENYCFYVST